MQRIPDGALALLDGLVASAAPEVLVPEARRLRLVILVHMPLGHRPADRAAAAIRMRERAVLEAAAAVVTTSQWSRSCLLGLYPLAPDRVHVAEPGVDRADLATGSAHGGELLCVASVTPEKGHDLLVEALESISELSWRCRCVGRVDREPAFVEELRRRTRAGGLSDRVDFAGPCTGSELDRSYATADVLVLASRAETYGMVVTEALARGLPVLAADVGGLTEAVGYGADGIRPGLLVPPEDPGALAAALRSWLGDAELRTRLRRAARDRRRTLCGWPTTASVLAGVLADASR
jgi:glycosyltransferase involved in cell wall biosynthesis